MNIGAALEKPYTASQRVLRMQTKLHRWAAADSGRRFEDLYNLVADPCFLAEAWRRVSENKGARTAGIDRRSVRSIEASSQGVIGFLEDLRAQIKAREFRPVPVRQVMIPKPGGKKRGLGIPTIADRVVQACLKLVLEPIFEADFSASSYGFRPKRRAQDAIADIWYHTSRGYEWVFEADITACFDEIDHSALLDKVRDRIVDRRILALIKKFLKAGILGEGQVTRYTHTGTPQGGILSPLLANIALSVLDDHIEDWWAAHTNATARFRHRQRGGATYRLVRYADDFVIMVFGTRDHADALWTSVSDLLAPMGLRLSPEKTKVVHINEGFDFLGFHIQRHTQRGSTRRYVYVYPSKKSLISIRRKLKDATKQITHDPPEQLFRRLSPMIRGWTQYFRHSSASKAFGQLRYYLWWRVWGWLRNKYPRTARRALFWRFNRTHWMENNGVRLFDPGSVRIQRYHYRGTKIPSPWDTTSHAATA
ncbi:group II intron reverse transcriptase/maturase [Gordonia sp. HNM0687]|uniref:Group II intron reverse transcriptase/maturase n=1 Tax=Gordonia mangrovi TaxID=2665643 RepID=A0A6L7GLD2_9ACTN|nr:group II intron reverse transcriptase/maturase [Gordonia mangrovi]MXP20227.1 group II intron reverse transcriptase/maturase [Gordonia mangrovi]UVF79163.1 group II intron reverse transcriptase/maturase [Gordonia mangrovi]